MIFLKILLIGNKDTFKEFEKHLYNVAYDIFQALLKIPSLYTRSFSLVQIPNIF